MSHSSHKHIEIMEAHVCTDPLTIIKWIIMCPDQFDSVGWAGPVHWEVASSIASHDTCLGSK